MNNFTQYVIDHMIYSPKYIEKFNECIINPQVYDTKMIISLIDELKKNTNIMLNMSEKAYKQCIEILTNNKIQNILPVKIKDDISKFEEKYSLLIDLDINHKIQRKEKRKIKILVYNHATAYEHLVATYEDCIKMIDVHGKCLIEFIDSYKNKYDFLQGYKLYQQNHRLDRIYHHSIESSLSYLIIKITLLKQLGYEITIPIKQIVERDPRQDLLNAKKEYYEGNYRVVLAHLRFALEFSFMNKLQYCTIAKQLKFGWLGTPFLKDVFRGCNKVGITLPVKKETLDKVYTICGIFIHRGYRMEIYKIWKTMLLIEYIIKKLSEYDISENKKIELTKWLNENANIRKKIQ